MSGGLRQILIHGASDLGLTLAGGQVDALLEYVQLLTKWNRAYNLTAVRDPAKMITRHIVDSLTVVPYLHGQRLLDVGSGAGLPGIVLSIARPELACVLLDSNRKKTRFCLQAAAELGLDGVEVVQERLENYAPEARFSTVISRAYGSTRDLLHHTRHYYTDDGRLIAMKGVYPATELSEIETIRDCVKVHPLAVPGLEAERHLVIVDMACAGGIPE